MIGNISSPVDHLFALLLLSGSISLVALCNSSACVTCGMRDNGVTFRAHIERLWERSYSCSGFSGESATLFNPASPSCP